MHATSAPTSPSAKPSWISIFPYTSLSNNAPTHVQHADANSPTNTTCVTTSVSTTPTESRSTNVNTATFGPIGNRIWPATPSSCTTARASMHKSPATCQNQSPGGLLSLFLKHACLPHILQTRSFNLAVG
jgi:hypothetical protein